MSESTNRVLPGSTNSLPSQPVPTTSRNKLKIYQWNADDIRPKLLELHDRPLNSDIDVLAFRNQNYKKLIKFHLLKVTLQSEKIETTSLEAVFYSSSERTLCSRSYTLSKKLAWRSYPFASRLLNHLGLISTTSIYQIHHHTQHNLFDPSLIKPGPSSLLLGDLNGHFQMWDPIQPQDQRGDEILDWILDNDLHILNDGSATPTSGITGNDSTSDISFVGATGQRKQLGD